MLRDISTLTLIARAFSVYGDDAWAFLLLIVILFIS